MISRNSHITLQDFLSFFPEISTLLARNLPLAFHVNVVFKPFLVLLSRNVLECLSGTLQILSPFLLGFFVGKKKNLFARKLLSLLEFCHFIGFYL